MDNVQPTVPGYRGNPGRRTEGGEITEKVGEGKKERWDAFYESRVDIYS